MRFSAFALSCALLFSAGCDTTHASVPVIELSDARKLVLDDLAALAEQPSELRWLRAYRHFDRHVEPHLTPERRLSFELRFAEIHRSLKLGDDRGGRLQALCAQLAADLQPQD